MDQDEDLITDQCHLALVFQEFINGLRLMINFYGTMKAESMGDK
jgi:hypothetical protein